MTGKNLHISYKFLFLFILAYSFMISSCFPPPVTSGVIGEVLTDSRDGKKYKTVIIGNQTWMAENLNYEAEGSKCYYNEPGNCEKYGRLYNWTTAKEVCPSDWHLPSKREYETLDEVVDGPRHYYYGNDAGKKLKAKNGWSCNSGWNAYGYPDPPQYIDGTDEFYFSALPGGTGSSRGGFHKVGYDGYWWSTHEYKIDSTIYIWNVNCYHSTNWYGATKSDYHSVRCLRDSDKARH
jgi:uncharacterized protein (TIGR02145 family)